MNYDIYQAVVGEEANDVFADFQELSGDEFLSRYGEMVTGTSAAKPWADKAETWNMGQWIVAVDWEDPTTLYLAQQVSV